MLIITDTVECSKIQFSRKTYITILHSLLGHGGKVDTRATAKSYGWNWTGQWMVCEFCAMEKSKQKPLKKISSSPVEKSEEQIYMDISSI
jgi:hypothetical protein